VLWRQFLTELVCRINVEPNVVEFGSAKLGSAKEVRSERRRGWRQDLEPGGRVY